LALKTFLPIAFILAVFYLASLIPCGAIRTRVPAPKEATAHAQRGSALP
jgi:hypothetical protein